MTVCFQDGAVVGPELQRIFDRVRESADFMPEWQLESVMVKELGEDWRDKFMEFHNRPFAAASIGQVHYAEMLGCSRVSVKVQYPGVAKSIDSDIRNVLSLVSMFAMLPKGLLLDKITAHMKVELAEECDYVREAGCGRRMREVLAGYPEYYVPVVFPELSSDQVLTCHLGAHHRPHHRQVRRAGPEDEELHRRVHPQVSLQGTFPTQIHADRS